MMSYTIILTFHLVNFSSELEPKPQHHKEARYVILFRQSMIGYSQHVDLRPRLSGPV